MLILFAWQNLGIRVVSGTVFLDLCPVAKPIYVSERCYSMAARMFVDVARGVVVGDDVGVGGAVVAAGFGVVADADVG